MSEYIQVGTAAMRDPLTGDFMQSVPLYIRKEDQGKVEMPVFDDSLFREMANKFRQYKKECRKEEKKKSR